MKYFLAMFGIFQIFECFISDFKYDVTNGISLLNSPKVKRSAFDDLQIKGISPPKIHFDIPVSGRYLESPFRLVCKANGIPTPSIQWYNRSANNFGYNGFSLIRENAEFFIYPGGILDISAKASGSYFCSATNMFGTVFSRKSEVQKSYLPDITISYETTAIGVQEKAVIECNTKPNIWINDYVVKHWEIKYGTDHLKYITKTEGRFSVINLTKVPQLHIRNVTKEDFRILEVRCVLVNRFFSSQIIEDKKWIKPKEQSEIYFSSTFYYDKCKGTEISVAQGSTIELPWCSYPSTAQVLWFKSNLSSTSNGKLIQFNTSKFSQVSERYGNILVKNIEVSDEGYYFVKRDYKSLQDYTPFHLRVTVKLGLVITPTDAFAAVGKSVTFRCTVTGYPVTNVFWLHNGVFQPSLPLIKPDIKTVITILTIDAVTTKNAGTYQCVAESRNILDNHMIDCAQVAASVIIKEMSPRLISQIPVVLNNDLYSTIKLDSASSTAKIQCSFNATPTSSIQWSLDDIPIPIDDVIVADLSEQHPYTITSVLIIDLSKLNSIGDRWRYGGVYQAEATNMYGSAKCKTLVFIEGVLKIRDRGKITLKHGQQATLKCYVISSDVPEITWSKIKDGKIIKFPETHREIESRDRREISISEVNKVTHDAFYECNATLGGKTISKVFNISVARPPLGVTPFQEEYILNERGIIENNCEPLADLDLPWYSWWEYRSFQAINNKSVIILPPEMTQGNIDGISAHWRVKPDSAYGFPELPDGVPTFLKGLPNIFSKIEIKFNKKWHMDNLTCVIQNNAGIARRSFRIIIAVIEFNVEPPSKKHVVLGHSFTVHCSPKPNRLHTTTSWSVNNNDLAFYQSNVSNRIYQFINGTLVVNKITENDPSKFLCIIKSISTDVLISKVVQIYLQVPARIMEMDDNIDVVKRSNSYLVCSVYGDSEKLHIEWYREDNRRWKSTNHMYPFTSEISDKKIHNLSLPLLNAIDDFIGLYKCIALNSFNKDKVEKIVNVSVVDVPGPIIILPEFTKIESRSLSMKWHEPLQNGKKPILEYVITWKLGIDRWKRNITKKEIVIEGLSPNQVYNISIRARNDVGLGEDYTTPITTLEDTPDGPVVDLRTLSKSSTTLELTWKPPNPLLQNGIIHKYEVCYRKVTTTEFSKIILEKLSWPKSTNEDALITGSDNLKLEGDAVMCIFVNGTNCVLTNLPKFTGYVFRIRPMNNKGMGPHVFTKERTMEDLPEKAPLGVTCTPSSRTILLQWNPPPQDSINGVSKGYTVKFFRPDKYGIERDGLLDKVFETKLTLYKLIPYSNYSIQVAVYNHKGSGPMSAPLMCATNEESPSEPKVVKAFQYNVTCALVVWTPPLHANGPLKQYCISTGLTEQWNHCKADAPQFYFKQLVCGLIHLNEYVFYVRAHNTKEGLPGNSTRLTIDVGSEIIVSIPRNVTVTEKDVVVLDCETELTYSKPEWFHYAASFIKTKIRSNYDCKIGRNYSLIINSASKKHNGTYVCELGKSSISYTVSVQSASNGTYYPTEIYYHTSSISSVSISWRSALSSGKDNPIIGFIIIVFHNQVIIKDFDIKAEQRSFTISNLNCGTVYELQLYAAYRTGNSTPAKLTVRTLGSKPQWANSTTLLASVYPNSLCFRLTSFYPGQECPADRFIVTLSSTFSGLSSADYGTFDFPISYKEINKPCNNISNLHPNTVYHYKIKAINNAGSTVNYGYITTLQPSTIAPSVEKFHNSGFFHFIYSYKYYIISVVVVMCLIVLIGFILYCMRRKYNDQMQPPQKVNNNIRQVPPTLNIATPSLSHRNRKLPEPPCNTYDSGMLSGTKIQEEDDDLKPYATYAPVRLPEFPTRPKQGKKSDPTPYNAGSQTHSYQYPDMVGSSQQQPSLTMDIHNPNTEYNNSSKQPLLKSRPLYSKGYSVGGEVHCPLLSQRAPELICQEPYRPGGSTWSNTTGSSTKELTQVFHPNYSVDLPLGLREQDEDNCSTTRAGTITALTNRMRVPDGFNPQDSYFESCSSGDDPGIQMFTQERFSGQQAVEPRFTHAPPAYIRQISTASSTYSSVDDPLRNLSVPMINAGSSSNFQSRFVPQDTLTEEDEQNNYQNKFVIV